MVTQLLQVLCCMYFVNNWFIDSFNWHYLYLIIYINCSIGTALCSSHVVAVVWQAAISQLLSRFVIDSSGELRYIELQVNNKHLCSQSVLVFKWITSVSHAVWLVIFLQFPYGYYLFIYLSIKLFPFTNFGNHCSRTFESTKLVLFI